MRQAPALSGNPPAPSRVARLMTPRVLLLPRPLSPPLPLLGLLVLALAMGNPARAEAVSRQEDWRSPHPLGQLRPLTFGWLLPWGPTALDTGARFAGAEEREDPIPLVTTSELTGTPGGPQSDLGCLALLSSEGLSFDLAGATEGVATPIRPSTQSLGGVRYAWYYSRSPGSLPWVFDCRLALALVRAAPVLRANGVTEVIFASHYRPSLGNLRMGQYHFHAQGLAIDIKGFRLGNGMHLDVARDYEGGLGFMDTASCLGRPLTPKGLLLRKLVCDLDEADVFETILTPDYDEAHWNHFHFSAFHPEQRSGLRVRSTSLLEVPLTALPDWALGRPFQHEPLARNWDRVAGRPTLPEHQELLGTLGIPSGIDPSEAAALLLAEPPDLSQILRLFSSALEEVGPAWLGVLGLAAREERPFGLAAVD